MRREILPQHVKKLHQPRRDVLLLAQVPRQGPLLRQPLAKPACGVRHLVPPVRSHIPHAEEAGRDWVQVATVELVVVSLPIDQDGSLKGSFGGHVIPDNIMRKVVKHFKGEEETWRRHFGLPVKDGLVDDFDFLGVSTSVAVFQEVVVLNRGELGGNFNDFILSASIDGRVHIANVV